jgi:aspartyl-tRNA(Asn)/glutamyl-tRNA(Gln) amidotransferase subunit B
MQEDATGPLENLTAARLVKLAEMVAANELSSTAAKEVLLDVIASGKEPDIIAKQLDLLQVSDTTALEKIVDQIIADNPKPVAEYKAGEEKVLGFLVGQVMKVSKGQANPPMVNAILKKKLGA